MTLIIITLKNYDRIINRNFIRYLFGAVNVFIPPTSSSSEDGIKYRL